MPVRSRLLKTRSMPCANRTARLMIRSTVFYSGLASGNLLRSCLLALTASWSSGLVY